MMIGSDDLEEFVCSSSEAVEFMFVRNQEDFTNERLKFLPEYTHQIFGEQERIYGYKNLKIQLYYTPDHLDLYLSCSYDDKVDPAKHYGTKPDDIFGPIIKVVPPGFTTSREEFLSLVANRQRPFKPFGDLIHVHVSLSDGLQYEVYKCDIYTLGFRAYHESLQTFVLWYIDAASFIDADDDKWSYYLIFQRSSYDGTTPQYSITGYLTLYNYYAYPDKIKPRISQVLILPPFQRKGLGTQLLTAVYNDIQADKQVLEILVEDPSPEFTALRDYVDCRNALKLKSFQTPLILDVPYSTQLEAECQSKLKLNKHQCRRVYEILKLKAIDRSNPEQYRQYRLFVKNRLNASYQKQKRDIQRLQRLGVMNAAELAIASAPLVSTEERMRELQQLYEEVELEYRAVLEKLAIITISD